MDVKCNDTGNYTWWCLNKIDWLIDGNWWQCQHLIWFLRYWPVILDAAQWHMIMLDDASWTFVSLEYDWSHSMRDWLLYSLSVKKVVFLPLLLSPAKVLQLQTDSLLDILKGVQILYWVRNLSKNLSFTPYIALKDGLASKNCVCQFLRVMCVTLWRERTS